MRIITQNVQYASVTIDGKVYSEIKDGYLLLVSFTNGDDRLICDKMIKKLINLRVFPDSNGKTNLSIKDINGSFLSISQFTLYADCKEGNRPSFINECLKHDEASALYDYFNVALKNESGLVVKTGVFGADMKVALLNDGPFTIILDSKELFK
jgi:D-tyrosyl-tRNA(Tyr) deacylase